MCIYKVYLCHCGDEISHRLQERCEATQTRLSHNPCLYHLPDTHRVYREGYLCNTCTTNVRRSITAVEDPEIQNGDSREEDPRTAKTILKQIHTKLHSRQGSEDDEHRDPHESGPVMKMVRRACRKLHIGKECHLDENGMCRFDQVEALQELYRKETTAPFSAEESRTIQTCIDTMTPEQAREVESWFGQTSPPEYTERRDDEAQASGSAPGPSRRAAPESQNTNESEHAEHAAQAGDEVETSGSASMPSGRVESDSHETNEAEHTEHAQQAGDEVEPSGSTVGPPNYSAPVSHDTNNDQQTVQGGNQAGASGSASRLYTTDEAEHAEHVEQGGHEADKTEASGSTARPSRQVGSESHDTDEDEDDEHGGPPDVTPTIVKLMKRVRGRLHIS
ncbi:hypothetical protein MMC18_000761 [Xylographa bjoerkii]|nr:hypothetical protein [Xylographa bjoerkii]